MVWNLQRARSVHFGQRYYLSINLQVPYETHLISKENLPPLLTNEMNSLGRLHSLTKIYLYQISLKSISSIFQQQINEDIIEKLNENKTLKKGKEFYLLHRLVIQEFAETNKKTKPNKINFLYLLMNDKKPVSHCKTVFHWVKNYIKL